MDVAMEIAGHFATKRQGDWTYGRSRSVVTPHSSRKTYCRMSRKGCHWRQARGERARPTLGLLGWGGRPRFAARRRGVRPTLFVGVYPFLKENPRRPIARHSVAKVELVGRAAWRLGQRRIGPSPTDLVFRRRRFRIPTPWRRASASPLNRAP
jgi:hypothetical protein